MKYVTSIRAFKNRKDMRVVRRRGRVYLICTKPNSRRYNVCQR